MSRAGKKYWCIVCAAAMVTAGFIGRESARASDYIGANGSDWSVPSNWNPSGPPSGGAASANISLAPSVPFNIFMNFPYTAGSALGSVNINSSTAQMLTVTMNSTANLFSGDEFIGNTGKATFAQSSGTNSVSGGLLIGYNAGASGTYNLSSTGNVYVNVYETVGLSGNGSFNQTGGTNTVGTAGSGQFRVAENSSSTASYSLSAGSFTINGSAWIGNAGNGTFTQTGGTATFNGTEIVGYQGTGNYNHSGGSHTAIDQYIGWGAGNTGTYTLSGGAGVNISGTQYVGYSGTGTMNQSAGSNATNILSVASAAGSHGTYGLSGSGNASAGSAYIGGSSSAPGGMGLLNIGGGSMTVSGELRVWNTPGTAVNLSGGSLSVGSLNPDSNPSRFNWTGGNLNVTAGAVIVDSTVPANLPSSLTLSATKSLSAVISGSATAEYIAYAGTGALIQNGGSNVVGTPSSLNSLNVGYLAGSSGSYDLSGSGSVRVNGDEVIGVSGAGVFTQSGGTHTVGSPTQLTFFHLGKNSGSSGTYQLTGGDLVVNSVEEFGIGGPATFVQSGGTHTVGTPSRQVSMAVGHFTSSSYTLSDTGILKVFGSENVPGRFASNTSSSTFTQSGGTNTIGSPAVNGSQLQVGSDKGAASGIYNLSAGDLIVNGAELLGGSGAGTFNQSGGTHTVGTPFLQRGLAIAIGSTGAGSYVLSGGSLSITGYEIVGGTFTQTGGSNSLSLREDIGGFPASYLHSGGTHTVGTALVSADLNLGYTSGFIASYALSGTGNLTVNGTTYVGGRNTGPGATATLDISGGTANIDTLKIWDTGDAAPGGARVNLSGGTLSLINLDMTANPARFNWTGGTLDFKDGMAVDVGEVLGAAVSVGSGMTLANSGGSLLNNGTITLNGGGLGGGGILENAGVIQGYGSIRAADFHNFGQLLINGTLVFMGGTATNTGEIELPALSIARIDMPSLFNQGTVRLAGGTISGTGTLINQSGATITGKGTITAALGTSSGNIAVADGTLNISNPFTNAGIIQVAGIASTLGGGRITNTGTIQGFGNINNPISNSSGTLEAVGGTLIMNALASTNTGLLSASVGNKLFFTQGLAVNAGIMSLAGGTFDNNGKPLSNTGQISGFGIFRSGGLTNNGAITFAGGTTTVNGNVTNAAGKKIEVRFAPAVFTGNFTNNGIFKSTGASITFTGTYTENGQFISDPAENFFQNVLIGSNGAWSGGLGDHFIIAGDLINNSTSPRLWDTSAAELDFTGGGLHQFASSAKDMGIDFAGYDNNFAWGKLVLGAADSLNIDAEALYIGVLDARGDLDSIHATGHIYYDLREPANAYLQGKTYQLDGGGTLTPVPEPSLAILVLAAIPLMSRRRHNINCI